MRHPSGADDPTIDTRNDRLDDGLNRCPQCGATDIQLRPATGMLICLFCRHEWSEARVEEHDRLRRPRPQLRGTTIASGRRRHRHRQPPSLITFKCAGCGAEVTVNTASR